MAQQREVTGRSYPAGVPCWVETQQPDVEAAIHFYGGILGWEFEDVAPPGSTGRYVIATFGGHETGAIAGPGTGAGSWSTYISVDEADAAARHLLSVGATLKSAPVDAGSGGVQAVLADPEGSQFRIWQALERPGAQAVNLPGGWIFMIRRPGYGDHLKATVDPNIRVRQSGDLVPRGFEDAVAWLASAAPGERPHWHVTFTVADRDRTAQEAERLGAVVLGQDDTEWIRTVLTRDPGGAVFTASQFTPPSG